MVFKILMEFSESFEIFLASLVRLGCCRLPATLNNRSTEAVLGKAAKTFWIKIVNVDWAPMDQYFSAESYSMVPKC